MRWSVRSYPAFGGSLKPRGSAADAATMGTMHDAGVALPQFFTVGAAVKSAHGGGRLIVTSGTVALEPGSLTRRHTGIGRVVHDAERIVMFKARLLPPFVNTGLVIHGEDVVAVAALSGWSRERLRAAIRDAGLELDERSSWVRTGLSLVRPWP